MPRSLLESGLVLLNSSGRFQSLEEMLSEVPLFFRSFSLTTFNGKSALKSSQCFQKLQPSPSKVFPLLWARVQDKFSTSLGYSPMFLHYPSSLQLVSPPDPLIPFGSSVFRVVYPLQFPAKQRLSNR